MFCLNDKVVYPMYGAGIIEEIVEKDVDGKNHSYYSIRIPNGNLKILVSVEKAEMVGLRSISDDSLVERAMEEVSVMQLSASENWNLRYKENMEKIKSGKLNEVAEVVRMLILRERKRGLSGAEKKMLNHARQILISEIAFSKGIEKEGAAKIVAEAF